MSKITVEAQKVFAEAYIHEAAEYCPFHDVRSFVEDTPGYGEVSDGDIEDIHELIANADITVKFRD